MPVQNRTIVLNFIAEYCAAVRTRVEVLKDKRSTTSSAASTSGAFLGTHLRYLETFVLNMIYSFLYCSFFSRQNQHVSHFVLDGDERGEENSTKSFKMVLRRPFFATRRATN